VHGLVVLLTEWILNPRRYRNSSKRQRTLGLLDETNPTIQLDDSTFPSPKEKGGFSGLLDELVLLLNNHCLKLQHLRKIFLQT
jgi:hypothetical protein